MGKKIAFLMMLLVLVTAVLLMVSCGGGNVETPDDWEMNETQHWKDGEAKADHTFGEWSETKKPTCDTDGTRTRECSVCGYADTETVDATGHTFKETEWKSDGVNHWHEATCEHKDQKKDSAPHTFVGGVCSVCKYKQPPTEGLVFKQLNNATYFTVTGAPAGITGSVVIPEKSEYRDVKVIGVSAFDGQTGITSVTLPASITTIDKYAFRNCAGLTTIVIPEKVTKINAHAFDGCASLTNIVIPASVTEISEYAFNGCTSLETVTFTGTSKLKTIGTRAFADCAKLETILIPETVTKLGGSVVAGTAFANKAENYENGVLYSGKYILFADPAKVVGEVTVKAGTKLIADYAFRDCMELTMIQLPSGIGKINNTVFENCGKLVETGALVEVGDFTFWNNSGVYALISYNGTATAVTLPANVNGNAYAISDYLFADDTTITSVIIPDGVTAIGAHAFDGCSALTTVAMGGDVTAIGGYAFNGCIALGELTIGEGVESIGDNAFNGCLALTELTLPDRVATIGKRAFANCSGIVKVYAGVGLTTVDEDAFLRCTAIDELYITSVADWCKVTFANMGAHPFSYYYNRELAAGEKSVNKLFVNGVETTELVIPAGVTKIGNYAFYNCDGITTLTIGADVTVIGTGSFLSYGNRQMTSVICTTTGWKRSSTNGAAGGANVTLTVAELTGENGKLYHYIYTA